MLSLGTVCWALSEQEVQSIRIHLCYFSPLLEEDPELEACSRLRLFESLTATKESSQTLRIEINIHNLHLESK